MTGNPPLRAGIQAVACGAGEMARQESLLSWTKSWVFSYSWINQGIPGSIY
ncbi:hypothetical protein ACOHYD_10070 [Desulfobacterota bacterium M19]